jgi:uncharacterized LabA/DUF88 family protein
MGVSAVFFDAGYMIKVIQNDHNHARVDLGKLSQVMADPDQLLRAYYYNCLPYQSNPPTDEERERYSNMHRFITRLKYLPRFEVRLGRLALRGHDARGMPIFVQKRVDCMVGVDMALLAGKRTITNVALFSGDSDLLPAVEAVKREGVLVTLWHGSNASESRPSRELYEMCDERRELTSDIVARILLP